MKYLSILLFWVTSLSFAKERPNVLLITADDLGWDSLGCTGNTLPNITPNIDKLANEGILIENGHIVTPICGPSREAIYTGLYPQNSGYIGHGAQPPKWWKNLGKTAPETSITTQLSKAGYLTGLIGKHGSTACKFNTPVAGANETTGMGRNPAKYQRDRRNQARTGARTEERKTRRPWPGS
ncbi:MAG: sulfatase-like hydrolase/transferase, partial [Verrucomicrobiota bacterium]